MTKDKPIAPNHSFEDSMRELDEIVGRMETGNMPLDGMIASYRRGAALARHCRDKLAAAQAEIKKLEGDELVPFENADGD